MSEPCPLCKYNAKCDNKTSGDYKIYDCINCGIFKLAGSVTRTILEDTIEKSAQNAALLSFYIRKMQGQKQNPVLDNPKVTELLEGNSLPTPIEQSDNLILLLGNNMLPGETKNIKSEKYQALIGAHSKIGFGFVFTYLYKNGFVAGKVGPDQQYPREGEITLTFKGWERYEELKLGLSDSQRVFMAMPFRDKRLNKIYTDHFEPAVNQTGLKLFRLDEEPKPGLIDDRLRVEIRRSKLLISELTGGNQGAYWEAGFAEGLRKPVIYTCEKNTDIHFDTNHCQTIFWEEDKLDGAMDKLKATIRNAFPGELKEEE